MSTPLAADLDSSGLTSLSDLEEDIPIDLLCEAQIYYRGTDLPPFIQKNLDPTIMPGDKHQAIPKTKSGTFPSNKSTKRVQLVCRAWKDNVSNRFWTYDHSKVRYIVKAFRTHAEPEDVPKISYHVWEGQGRFFQETRVAFDADDHLYGPDSEEKSIRKGFGTTDTNKELRTYIDDIETQKGRSSTKGKGASKPGKKALPERDLAGEDDDEDFKPPTTHSTKRENTTSTFGEGDSKPKVKNIKDGNEKEPSFRDKSKEPTTPQFNLEIKGASGVNFFREDKSDEPRKHQDKFSGLRENLNKRRDTTKTERTSDGDSSYQVKGSHDKADGVSDGNSSHHVKSRKLIQREDRSEADNINDGNSSPQGEPATNQESGGLYIKQGPK